MSNKENAHVVSKFRTGGRRDEAVHHYMVGPVRETLEQALLDLRLFERAREMKIKDLYNSTDEE